MIEETTVVYQGEDVHCEYGVLIHSEGFVEIDVIEINGILADEYTVKDIVLIEAQILDQFNDRGGL